MTTPDEFRKQPTRTFLVRLLGSFVFWRSAFIGIILLSPLLFRCWMVSMIPDIPEPFDVEEFCRVKIAPGENAFDHYREACRLKRAVDAARKDVNCDELGANYDEVIAKGWSVATPLLTTWLDDYRTSMTKWRKGTECQEALLTPIREMNSETVMSEIPIRSELVEIARIAQCEAIRLEGVSDFEGACQSWISILRCGRHVGTFGRVLDRYRESQIHRCATQGINHWAASAGVTKAALLSCYSQIKSADLMVQPLSTSLKVEYVTKSDAFWPQLMELSPFEAASHATYAQLAEIWILGEPLYSKRLERHILANQLPEIDKPLSKRQPVAGTWRVVLFEPEPAVALKPRHLSTIQIERAIKRSPWAESFLPLSKIAVGVIARERAQQVTIELALLVQMYRRDHDQFPEELSELVPTYVRSLPVDPCDPDGRLIRYRRDEPQSAVVWSVGPDGSDNEGEVEETNSGTSSDVGFQLMSH